MQQPDTLFEGKYEILAKIREGGMGTIYKVRHRLLDEVRIVKVIRPVLGADEELKRRFSEEARTATRLKHPNIATVHDYAIDEDGTAYLVMEFIEGVTLSELLRSQGPPGLPLTLEIAHQTLSALGYLHRKNVVHRDVAPDNLMLTTDEEGRPRIKLIDLGIAKALDRRADLTSTGAFLGKLKYASPEQYGALPKGETLDGRSDLFSFGIVLYELLTGVRPFEGETPTELLRSHVTQPPLPFPQTDPGGRVPEALREVVLKALSKNREDRFASAEELDRALGELRQRHPLGAEMDSTVVIASTARETTPFSGSPVTPSAQDRLDRQFAGPTPARPTPTPVDLGPTATPTPQGFSFRRPGCSLRIAVQVAAVAAVGVAGLLLVRSKTGNFQASPVAMAPPPPSVAAVTPNPEPTAVFVAATVPTREPTEVGGSPGGVSAAAAAPATAPPPPPTALPSHTPVPAATPRPTLAPAPTTAPRASATQPADARVLRTAAEDARWRCGRAREAANQARAAQFALDLYRRGQALETEASRLLARGDDAGARSSFEAALKEFEEARAIAIRHARGLPAAAPTPSQDHRATADRALILETVHRFVRAQESLDIKLYESVFPSVKADRLAASWEKLRSQSVTLRVKVIDLSPGGALAEVRADETRIVRPRSGSDRRTQGERTLLLEKRGDSWVMTSSRITRAPSEKR